MSTQGNSPKAKTCVLKEIQNLQCSGNETSLPRELHKSIEDGELSNCRDMEMDETDLSASSNNGINGDSSIPANLVDASNSPISFMTLGKIAVSIFSGDEHQEFVGCQMARRILSQGRIPLIDSIISSGVIPKCIELLKSPQSETQLEAAWVVTNIACGNSEQTNYIVAQGAVDPLIDLLKSPHTNLIEQAIWALGNIAGDGPNLRDMLIAKGVVEPLVALVNTQHNPSLLRNITWTLCNLCRSSPSIEITRQILPALVTLIMLDDTEIVSDACWTLSYISDGPNEKIEEVIKSGVTTRVVQLLDSSDNSLVSPCLRIIGHMVTGSDSQTECVLECGPVVELLGRFLVSPKSLLIKEAAFAISNVTAGTVSQIERVIDRNLVPLLINVVNNGDVGSQKEAIIALKNITSGGSLEQIGVLYKHEIIPTFCRLLKFRDLSTVLAALAGVENILKRAAEVDQLDIIRVEIEGCGGLDTIEVMQEHDDMTVCTAAYSIMDTYFLEVESEELSSSASSPGQFKLVQKTPESSFNL